MRKSELTQSPLLSTLMSSIKVAYDYYYNDELSDSMLFGLTGHAFISHITNGLGPCAAYTFDMDGFNKLTKDGLGIDMFCESHFISKEASFKDKKVISNYIKGYLDTGHLVLMTSYENQVIKDYSDTHYILTKPWGNAPSETDDLKIDSLDGMKDFMSISKITTSSKIDLKKSIMNSLKYGIDLLEGSYKMVDSGFGIYSYDFMLDKINENNYNGHGNWWTCNVWAESRKMASIYMKEIIPYIDKHSELVKLSELFLKSSELFVLIGNKNHKLKDKIDWIKELTDNELAILVLLKKITQ